MSKSLSIGKVDRLMLERNTALAEKIHRNTEQWVQAFGLTTAERVHGAVWTALMEDERNKTIDPEVQSQPDPITFIYDLNGGRRVSTLYAEQVELHRSEHAKHVVDNFRKLFG
jgi:hypothetical protein